MTLRLFFLFLCVPFLAISNNYEYVDNKVKKYPKSFGSIERLANRIEKDFSDNKDKVRAAFYWISTHIAYDNESFRNGTNGYESIRIPYDGNEKEYLYQLNREYAERALQRKKGVCEGYSQLMRFVCEAMEIECVVIEGYAKNDVSEIGKRLTTTNHAWNAVNIDNEWKLIDVTWAAGHSDTPDSTFTFDLDENYYFIQPKGLILSHFPKEEKWQLLDYPISKKDFSKLPIVFGAFFSSNISLEPNSNGIILCKTGDVITIPFINGNIEKIYFYAFDQDTFSNKAFLKENEGRYLLEIPVNHRGNLVLTIYDEGEGILQFKVITRK